VQRGESFHKSMIDVLTPIWQRVFTAISPSVSKITFFDLGGDSFLAVSLFNEIARVLGREPAPRDDLSSAYHRGAGAVLEQPTIQRFRHWYC